MQWQIVGKIRAHIVGFSGLNFSGERWEVDIWPVGGQQGAEIDGRRLKSVGIIAPPGVRMVLMTSTGEDTWESQPWRCVQVIPGFTFDARDGKRVGVQVPDLDRMDPPHALYLDPDIERGFPQVERFEDGEGWTFGRKGHLDLKTNIRAIRVERFKV
jgi:hypothetical protein